MVESEDGSEARVLLASADAPPAFSVHRWPTWSRDGSAVAFVSQMPVRPAGHPELDRAGPGIYMIHADGTALCKVAPLRDPQDPYPAWSPDVPLGWRGSKIVYADAVDDRPCGAGLCRQWDLFLVDATCDAPEPVNLSRTPDRNEAFATWSPDATRIAASVQDLDRAEPGRRARHIVIFDVVGATLLEGPVPGRPERCLSAIFPRWSRRGDRIAACCVGEAASELWVYSIPSGSWARLAAAAETGLRSSWSPDDTQVVFDREEDPALSVLATTAPGAGRRLLAPPAGSTTRYLAPEWSHGAR